MKPVSTEIFNEDLEEGRIFLMYVNGPGKKDLSIIIIERKDYSKKYKPDRILKGYSRKLYDMFSGFGGVRFWGENRREGQRDTLKCIQDNMVKHWVSGDSYYAQFYELTPDEVEKHVIMEMI